MIAGSLLTSHCGKAKPMSDERETVRIVTSSDACTWGQIVAMPAAPKGIASYDGNEWKPLGDADTRDANKPSSTGAWQVWAMMPESVDTHLSMLRRVARGDAIEPMAASGADAVRSGGVAVLSINGFIEMRCSRFTEFFGGTSTEMFASRFSAAMGDPNVSEIVIDVNSPGGEVAGVQELSDLIFKARGTKRITAIANPLAASAAFWIATAADRLVVTPSGDVGSVGVIAIHTDKSAMLEQEGVKKTIIKSGKFKAEGNPFETLDQTAIDFFQSRVDQMFSRFVADVARNRGVSKTDVRQNFGQGRIVMARDAVKAGMADSVGTMADVLSNRKARNSARRRLASTNLLTPSRNLR